jgi:hypothetical protein
MKRRIDFLSDCPRQVGFSRLCSLALRGGVELGTKKQVNFSLMRDEKPSGGKRNGLEDPWRFRVNLRARKRRRLSLRSSWRFGNDVFTRFQSLF